MFSHIYNFFWILCLISLFATRALYVKVNLYKTKEQIKVERLAVLADFKKITDKLKKNSPDLADLLYDIAWVAYNNRLFSFIILFLCSFIPVLHIYVFWTILKRFFKGLGELFG